MFMSKKLKSKLVVVINKIQDKTIKQSYLKGVIWQSVGSWVEDWWLWLFLVYEWEWKGADGFLGVFTIMDEGEDEAVGLVTYLVIMK